MALAKRIIPCLDIDAGRVVKGVKFVDIRDAGDPVEAARRYDEQGADELCFLDITASSDERDTMVAVVETVAAEVFIPLTVGGGVRGITDIRRLLNGGRGQGVDQHRGGVRAGVRGAGRSRDSVRSASWSRSTPSRRKTRTTAPFDGRCSPTAGGARPESMPLPGASAWPGSGPARSC